MASILVGRGVQIKKKLQKQPGNPRFQQGLHDARSIRRAQRYWEAQ